MKTSLVTAPVKLGVTLKEAKQHLRVEIGWTDEDDYIKSLIGAATQQAQQITRRKFITQTHDAFLDRWPGCNYIELPFGSLQSVTHVKYTDTDGTLNTVDSGDYTVDTDSDRGRVVLAYGESWPTEALAPDNPIEIRFICGYGDDETDIEPSIRQAMKILLSNWYENREETVIGTITSSIDLVKPLLLPFILW